MTDANSPPADRFCDLVMKGGITSGIVYPRVASRLARHYRFKNIGGTSAGAIAAAATAAAEYRRRQTNSEESFDELQQLPEKLGAQVSSSETKLLSLFQPASGCHRLFNVLLSALNAGTTGKRIWRIAKGLLLTYWPATLSSVAMACLVYLGYGLIAGLLSLLIFLLLLIGLSVYRDFSLHLVNNNYGMCTGMGNARSKHEALTPWLHGLIQELAGLNDGKPLTFGDLWNAKGFPPDWLALPHGETPRSIDLRMFTTNLSVGRPFIFPLTNETCRLFYMPGELAPFLPTDVMKWMLEHSADYAPNSDSDPPASAAPSGLKELPPPKDFPVLLAARMSLSFPLLLSAMPLWAIDYDRPIGKRVFQKCMFSDGGISSNFPIHLFDGMLPAWPTFGIQLEPKLPDRENMIFLPDQYYLGYGERWDRFVNKKKHMSRMGGFLGAITSTMRNWNDNTLSRMPGVRGRVVRVRLNENEGGMNLNMEPKIIREVAKRGEQAADALIKRFAPETDEGPSAKGWDEQRWIRFGVILTMLHKSFAGINLALDDANNHATSYENLINSGKTELLPGEPAIFSTQQADALQKMLVSMRQFNSAFNPEVLTFDAVPKPDLKVRPPL